MPEKWLEKPSWVLLQTRNMLSQSGQRAAAGEPVNFVSTSTPEVSNDPDHLNSRRCRFRAPPCLPLSSFLFRLLFHHAHDSLDFVLVLNAPHALGKGQGVMLAHV